MFQSSGPFRRSLEIVDCMAGSNLLGGEGDVEVIVEVAVVGRNPGDAPAHPLADGLNFLDRGARHRHVRDVMIFEMLEQTFDMIDLERASDALVRCPGSHHEMFDEELAAAVE